MASPRISVIIPVHNADKHLEQCLESVLSQTERNIEVICVNDSSTDASQAILESYASHDTRLKLLQAECHCAGSARNIGLDIATGKYLSFLDADDFFETEMLEQTANALDGTGADIVVYGSWLYDTATDTDRHAKWNLRSDLLPEKAIFSWRDMPDFIFNAFGNYTWNKLFRGSFVRGRRIKFQEIPRTNDLLFTCIALVDASGITTIDRPFTHYRVNTASSLQATNDRTPTAFLDAFLALDTYLKEKKLYTELQTSYMSHLLDGILANANSVKSLESLKRIKTMVLDEIEPRFGFLNWGASTFDFKQLEQYRDLINLDLPDYLLAQTRRLIAEKDELARYTEWVEWRLWRQSGDVTALDNKIKSLEETLKQIEHSRSYRLAKSLGAPLRALQDFKND